MWKGWKIAGAAICLVGSGMAASAEKNVEFREPVVCVERQDGVLKGEIDALLKKGGVPYVPEEGYPVTVSGMERVNIQPEFMDEDGYVFYFQEEMIEEDGYTLYTVEKDYRDFQVLAEVVTRSWEDAERVVGVRVELKDGTEDVHIETPTVTFGEGEDVLAMTCAYRLCVAGDGSEELEARNFRYDEEKGEWSRLEYVHGYYLSEYGEKNEEKTKRGQNLTK
ncbi:MAG: hypothetical protein Q4F41_03320 [Eubacteriales bacterium]|nr:hypothetical protein [Eubacteriales bacterium]